MKRRENIFGFGRKAEMPVRKSKRRGSGLTIPAASRMAREAGYRGTYSFSDWLHLKRLEDRSPMLIDKLGSAYRDGIDSRQHDDWAKSERKTKAGRAKQVKQIERERIKEQREMAARIRRDEQERAKEERAAVARTRQKEWLAKQREKAEEKRAKQQQQKDIETRAEKLARLDKQALERHYARGGSLEEFLHENPRSRNPIPAALVAAANDYIGYQVTGAAAGAGMKLGSKLLGKATRGMKRNPAQAAAEVSEEFHGRPVKELVEVSERVHYHKHLAELGKLKGLVVLGVDGYRHTIKGFKNALLCCNEDKNQLFVIGGDQSINLKDFGIRKPHEVETLGEVEIIDYATTKEHLGEEGGAATYRHKFRQTNEDGRHVTVRGARRPDLQYDRRNQKLLFSGGSYIIRAEGVDR